MTSSSDKSDSIHSDSDDSRDNDRGRESSSPEVGLTKGKGKRVGKGRARNPPARKHTAGKYLILIGPCMNMLHNGNGRRGNRKTKGEDLRGKHG